MTGYTAVITGGTRGIGAAIAHRMLDRGYRVVSLSLEEPDFAHENFAARTVDLLDKEAVREAAAEIAARESVTHFVHNAGAIRPALLEDVDADDLLALAQLHLGAAITLVQAFLPAMKAAGFGRVIFNASRAALGVPTRTSYSATKAGIIGMARTWALELAPHQITVNVVAPGPILTDNFWQIIPKDSEREAALAQRIPVGRLGTTDDVANAMMFFAEPASGFVTGQTLFVCGGSSVGTIAL